MVTDPTLAACAARRCGEGPAVFLLHGIGSSATSWNRVAPRLPGYRLIAPDFPGYGDTPDAPGLTLEALADRLAAAIDAEGGSAHLVGVSFGALVALALARRSPERVRSLVLADATLGRGGFPPGDRERWLAGRLAFADGLAAGAEKRAREIAAPGAADDAIAEIAANMRRARPAGYRAVAAMVAGADARPWLDTIPIPALVLCGAADAVVGVPLAETIAAALPDARFAVIAGAGHAPHVEQPGAFADAVRAFVDGVEAPERVTRVALAGAGAIAGVLIDGIARGDAGLARVVAIGARASSAARAQPLAERQSALVVRDLATLGAHAPLVIEAAGGDAVRAHAAQWLDAGADVMILSAGALIDARFRDDLLARARANRRRILVPSGAIAGVDGVRAGALGGLRTLTLRTTKPPRGLAGAPHILASGIDLAALTVPTTVFSGTVAEAVRGFPSNVNVAAVLALAGRGVDVRVEVVADPTGDANVQGIEASGAFGTFRVRLDNRPSPANPKTSMLAPLSALAMLRRFSEPLWVGA
jgi:aspartate dehydrogenase